MPRLTADRLFDLASVLGMPFDRDIKHAARVVEAAEELLSADPDMPSYQSSYDALDAALDGTDGD